MADTIVLMNKGVIQQEAPPEVVYREPSNLFAAQFIGVPHEYCAAWGRSHDIRIPSESVVIGTEPESFHYTTKGRSSRAKCWVRDDLSGEDNGGPGIHGEVSG